jgi:hypothetical protein
VSDDYAGTSPDAFTGGTIKEAIVDIPGEHFVGLEMEALAMMKRECAPTRLPKKSGTPGYGRGHSAGSPSDPTQRPRSGDA